MEMQKFRDGVVHLRTILEEIEITKIPKRKRNQKKVLKEL